MLYYTVLLQTTITSHLLEMHERARSGFGPGLFLLVVSIIQKKYWTAFGCEKFIMK